MDSCFPSFTFSFFFHFVLTLGHFSLCFLPALLFIWSAVLYSCFVAGKFPHETVTCHLCSVVNLGRPPSWDSISCQISLRNPEISQLLRLSLCNLKSQRRRRKTRRRSKGEGDGEVRKTKRKKAVKKGDKEGGRKRKQVI